MASETKNKKSGVSERVRERERERSPSVGLLQARPKIAGSGEGAYEHCGAVEVQLANSLTQADRQQSVGVTKEESEELRTSPSR